ncbi:MAG: CoA-binding protein [Clostridia bacterium]|nr:CoA-binding protein [Clostridia bacterium]
MMEKLMLTKNVWAVVGANQNPEKYGNKIYKALKSSGFEVYAVNPVYDSVEGDVCYASLSALPRLPDVINIVVSPDRALSTLTEASSLGIKYIWFQPGTHDEKTDAKVKELGLEAVYACALVATKLYCKE